jgi:DNA-binding SARP family transcriptional activator
MTDDAVSDIDPLAYSRNLLRLDNVPYPDRKAGPPMSDMEGRPELRICVIGAFRVLANDGHDLTPRGRKARALLAILALTPTRRRSRPALQDKLWSDRGPEQGAASLRQTLTEIRNAFGERYRDCLVSDMRGIGLDADGVTVDLDTADLSEFASMVEAPVLLEDIDVADEEFEHWLRNQRTGFEQRIASLKPGVAAPLTKPSGVAHTRSAPARPWIRILAPSAMCSESGLFLSRLVGDRIAQGLIDHWGVEVRDDGEGLQGVRLRVEALPVSREVVVNVALLSADGALQLWSDSEAISLENGFVSDAPGLQALINRSVDIAAQYLNRTGSSPEACVAFGQAFEAVQRMFKIELTEVDRADALLASAYEADPRPVYLAWRAYIRSIYAGELYNRRDAIQESDELARRAIEGDPHNATVLALTSHVYGFVLRKWAFAHQLAELSIKCNPALSIGHTYLGKAKLELGEREAGYRETCRGLELSGQAPYRHMLYTAYGLASLATGRFDEALRAAEIVHAMVPIFRPPRRYLVPLYLRLGERDKARDAFEKMCLIEPSFSLQAMREQSYPSNIIRASGLLTFSDSDL